MSEKNNIEEIETNKCLPGSSEKKRAVMMYLLVGIILLSTGNRSLSGFEAAHFKQSLGWWMLFLLILLINTVLLFIPFLKVLAVLIILVDIIIVGFFIKQAWDGKYYIMKQESPLFIFQGIGERAVNIFDLKLTVKKDTCDTGDSDIRLE